MAFTCSETPLSCLRILPSPMRSSLSIKATETGSLDLDFLKDLPFQAPSCSSGASSIVGQSLCSSCVHGRRVTTDAGGISPILGERIVLSAVVPVRIRAGIRRSPVQKRDHLEASLRPPTTPASTPRSSAPHATPPRPVRLLDQARAKRSSLGAPPWSGPP